MPDRSTRERLDAPPPGDVAYAPAVSVGVRRWIVGAFAVAIGAAVALAVAHHGRARPSAVERARRGPAVGIVPPAREAPPPAASPALPQDAQRRAL